MTLPISPSPNDLDPLLLRHLRIGWWGLGLVVLLGLGLEVLHALKVSFYLSPDNETRRLMWRLAHAHGGLLCLLQIGFAATLRIWPQASTASWPLTVATALVPSGFFLGGLGARGGDPSLGIVLVPLGAVLLLLGIYRTGRALGAAKPLEEELR